MSPEEYGAKMAKAIREKLPLQCRIVTVLEVQADQLTATVRPIDSGAELYDVRLKAIADGNLSGIVGIPKVGSTALINIIGNDANFAFLSLCSEVEKYVVKIGNSLFEVTEQGFLLQRGNESLLKLLQDMVTQMESLTVNVAGVQSSLPVNKAAFTAIKQRLLNLFSNAS